ncbi:MAG: hypothetical protein IT291_09960 [Deltaproteobacteria bacterium]|nr:hypothetical protein [Deltaproteobacteria bacterium]
MPVAPNINAIETNAISGKIGDYREEINTYLALGYTVSASPELTLGGDTLDAVSVWSHKLEKTGLDICYLSDPLAAFQSRYRFEKGIPSELSKHRELKIPRYHVVSHKLENSTNRGIVYVYDYLSSKDPLILAQELELTNDNTVEIAPQDKIHLFRNLREAIHSRPVKISSRTTGLSDNALGANSDRIVSVIEGSKLPTATRKVLSDLLNEYLFIVEVNPPNEEYDKGCFNLGNSPDGRVQAILSPDTLRDIGYGKLVAHGDVSKITIARLEDSNALPEPTATLVKGGPVVTHSRDKFGNTRAEYYRPRHDLPGGLKVEHGINIFPRLPLCHNDNDNQPLAINIDLAPFGAGEIRDFLYVKPIQSVTTVGNYTVYSRIPMESINLDEIKAPLEDFRDGCAKAERLYGLRPGEVIRNFYIVYGSDPQAIVPYSASDTVVLYDEILRDSNMRPHLELVGFHEGKHAIANRATNRLLYSHDFANLFYELSDQRGTDRVDLTQYSENQFINDLKQSEAGHAHDNPDELYASLGNIVFNNPDFEMTVENGSLSLKHLMAMGDLLGAMSKNIQDAVKLQYIPPTAPIIDEVERKKSFVNSAIAKRQADLGIKD